MDRKPYYFNKASIEIGKKFSPRVYSCFYILAPEKIYIFLTSKDKMSGSNILFIGLGGALGGLIKGSYDYINEKRVNIKHTNQIEIDELPEPLKDKIPPYRRLILIPKSSVSKIKFFWGDMLVSCKSGKWINFNLFPKQKSQAKKYLKFTHWF